jgi:hypothetical protein
MALDLKWLLSADDKATPVFDKVQAAGKQAADGIQGAFSGVLGKFNLLTGAVTGLAAVAGGMMFKAIISETVNWELSVAKLGSTLGMTTEQASVYAVAAHTMGVDLGTVESAGLKLAKTLGSNEEVIKRLGVATRDSNGNLRSTAELMPEVNEHLSKLKAGTDRNVAAMEIYGRSWNDVRALLKINSAAMEEAKETATRLHLVVGDEGVKQAKEYKKHLNEISLVGKSLSIQLGNVLLPAIVEVGAFMGKNAPLLAETFGYALQFVGKTAMTVGSALGLMGYQIVTLGSAVGNFLTGNFAQAKKDWQDANTAGIDFMAQEAKRWTDWNAKPVKSKAVTGETLDHPDPAAAAALDAAAKAKLALMEKELAAFKELQAQKSALIKEQAAIELSLMKASYDQGLVSTQEYFASINQAALDSDQQKFDNASLYLNKEEGVLAYVRGKYGENSQEFQAESGKHNKAVQDMQSAQMEYAKTYLDGEEKMRQALKARVDAYDKLELQTLQDSGAYVDAERKKQDMDARSIDFLRLKKEAEAGVADAVAALAQTEQTRATALIAAQIKEHEAAVQYASDIAKMQDEVDALNGADKTTIDLGAKIREGLASEGKLHDALNLATSRGNQAEIAALSQKIGLQDTLNARLKSELDLIQRKGVLSGEIVGFNGDTPIYADGYNKSQQVNGYVTNSQLRGPSTPSITTIQNSPFVGINSPFSGYLLAKGINNVPYDNFPAILHKDEAVVPAAYNNRIAPQVTVSGGTTITIPGGIQVIVQGGNTSSETVDEIARQLLPRLEELIRRRRA